MRGPDLHILFGPLLAHCSHRSGARSYARQMLEYHTLFFLNPRSLALYYRFSFGYCLVHIDMRITRTPTAAVCAVERAGLMRKRRTAPPPMSMDTFTRSGPHNRSEGLSALLQVRPQSQR